MVNWILVQTKKIQWTRNYVRKKNLLQKFVGHSKSFLSQVASSRPHTYQKEHDWIWLNNVKRILLKIFLQLDLKIFFFQKLPK